MTHNALDRRTLVQLTAASAGVLLTGKALSPSTAEAQQPDSWAALPGVPAAPPSQMVKAPSPAPLSSIPDLGAAKHLPARAEDAQAAYDSALARIPSFHAAAPHIGAYFQAADSALNLSDLPTLSLFHCDLYLAQAGVILERVLRAQSEYSEIARREFNNRQDATGYDKARAILQREIAANALTVNAEISRHNLDAEIALANGLAAQVSTLDDLLKAYYDNGIIGHMVENAKYVAWGNHLPLQASGMDWNWKPQWRPYTPAGLLPDLMQTPAAEFQEYEMKASRDRISADRAGLAAAHSSSLERQKGLNAKKTWEEQNALFQLDRIKVADELATARAIASSEPNGALNFAEQRAAMQERIAHDVREVLARVLAAQAGLQILYGYSSVLDPQIEAIRNADGSVRASAKGLIESLVAWVRTAQYWLDAFQRTEQSYVLALSLAQADKDAWESGKKIGAWTFNVDESKHFPNERNVRLRGLSLSVVKHRGAPGVWQGSIQVPAKSYCMPVGASAPTPLDQSAMRPCRCGRVLHRESARAPDVIGVSSLRNASPFGRWTISLGDRSVEGEERGHIDDLVLDLVISSQPA